MWRRGVESGAQAMRRSLLSSASTAAPQTAAPASDALRALPAWARDVLACPITQEAVQIDERRGVIVSSAAGVEWALSSPISLHPADAKRTKDEAGEKRA
jgi:hypothetical protein